MEKTLREWFEMFPWHERPEGAIHWTDFKNQLYRNEIVLTETSEGGKQ
jgi:hypothetical protein